MYGNARWSVARKKGKGEDGHAWGSPGIAWDRLGYKDAPRCGCHPGCYHRPCSSHLSNLQANEKNQGGRPLGDPALMPKLTLGAWYRLYAHPPEASPRLAHPRHPPSRLSHSGRPGTEPGQIKSHKHGACMENTDGGRGWRGPFDERNIHGTGPASQALQYHHDSPRPPIPCHRGASCLVQPQTVGELSSSPPSSLLSTRTPTPASSSALGGAFGHPGLRHGRLSVCVVLPPSLRSDDLSTTSNTQRNQGVHSSLNTVLSRTVPEAPRKTAWCWTCTSCTVVSATQSGTAANR